MTSTRRNVLIGGASLAGLSLISACNESQATDETSEAGVTETPSVPVEDSDGQIAESVSARYPFAAPDATFLAALSNPQSSSVVGTGPADPKTAALAGEVVLEIEGAGLTEPVDIALRLLDFHNHPNPDVRRLLWAFPPNTSELVFPTNPLIEDFHRSLPPKYRLTDEQQNDETAWCASFLNWCIAKANMSRAPDAQLELRSAAAQSFKDWGSSVDPASTASSDLSLAQRGDILVFKRRVSDKIWGGHVGFYLEHSDSTMTVLGGNQYYKDDFGQVSAESPASTSLSGVTAATMLKRKLNKKGEVQRELIAIRTLRVQR